MKENYNIAEIIENGFKKYMAKTTAPYGKSFLLSNGMFSVINKKEHTAQLMKILQDVGIVYMDDDTAGIEEAYMADIFQAKIIRCHRSTDNTLVLDITRTLTSSQIRTLSNNVIEYNLTNVVMDVDEFMCDQNEALIRRSIGLY